MKRFHGMVSGLPEAEIARLRGEVEGLAHHPEYAGLDFKARALLYLTDKGVDTWVIVDVVNSGKKKFQDVDFFLYTFDHPELLAWLDPNTRYSTIKAMGRHGP